MTILAGLIGGIIAARFVFIDRSYTSILEKYQVLVTNVKTKIYSSNDDRDLHMHTYIELTRKIELYVLLQAQNIKTDVYRDFACIILMTTLGFLIAYNVLVDPILLQTRQMGFNYID